MSVEIEFEGIPKRFQPIYSGSASEAINSACDLIQKSSVEEQRELLCNQIFRRGVSSALFNKDQRRREEALKLVESFDEEIQPAAQYIFLGEITDQASPD